MIIVGVDPSFTGMGVSIIDTDNKTITLAEIKGSMGKTFSDTFNNSIDRVIRFNKLIDVLYKPIFHFESPFPNRDSSCGLYQLDSLLMYSVASKCESIYISHPTHLSHLHNKKKYTKTESVELSHSLLDVFINNDYTVNKNRYSHNISESLLYAIRSYVRENNDLISNKVKLLCPNISNNKEVRLV